MRACIGYIMNVFPALTHTFIASEIEHLSHLGRAPALFSIHCPGDSLKHWTNADGLKVTYIFPLRAKAFLGAHLFYLLIHPLLYAKALGICVADRDLSLRQRWRSLFHFTEGVYLAWLARQENLVHLHAHFAGSAASIAMVAAGLLGISFSFTAHGSDILLEDLLLRRKLAAAAFVIAISRFNKSVLLKKAAPLTPEIAVVHCGIDPVSFSAAPPRHQHAFTLLTVASLKPVKGYDTLLRAVKKLHDADRRLRLVIVGDGDEAAALTALSAQLGLNEVIQWEGAVPHHQVAGYYDNADLFVLASNSEGIPVVLMEAMAKQLPVVATRITGIPELVTDEENGLLVPPNDPAALADAIGWMMDNPDKAASMGINGRQTVMRDFNAAKNADRLAAIFDQQVFSGSPAAGKDFACVTMP